jgi:asparagine synthase (glutamine-hydrolysing)
MAHSLEIRVPLIDVGLFRALAPLLVTANPPTKADLARAPRKGLPEEILRRPKTGFSIPMREWTRGKVPRASRERGLRGWARYVCTS